MTRASEWAIRVKEWHSSGEGAREFCEGREFSAKALQWWSSRFRRRGFPRKTSVPGGGAALARVVRRAEAVFAGDEAVFAGDEAAVIIELSGARVRVGVGCSRAALAMVVDVLRGAAVGSR